MSVPDNLLIKKRNVFLLTVLFVEVESAGKSIGPDIGEYLTKKSKYKMIYSV